ncbi:FMN-binding negative transcriptional regulator [Ponticoccus litoralis]|uniref:FMN-binding negative transcriptional regulator n=1 Tax=Ponticoccus litoralis TaxID=422297 RepID=A0AAW9SHD3_9RHOB
MLCVSAEPVPLLAHVPFLLSEDGAGVDLHLVRSNPICRATGPARLVVTGPDGYVSPDWYGIADQVPTWNYTAVHLSGRLEALPADRLPEMLARQSAFFEARLLPKPPWTMDKMSAEVTARFLRMILPFRLHVEDVQSTVKLGQNKDAAVRLAAARPAGNGVRFGPGGAGGTDERAPGLTGARPAAGVGAAAAPRGIWTKKKHKARALPMPGAGCCGTAGGATFARPNGLDGPGHGGTVCACDQNRS